MTTDATISIADTRAMRESRVVPMLAVAAIVLLGAGVLLDIFGALALFAPPILAPRLAWFRSAHFAVRLGTMLAFLVWLHARYSSLRLVGWGPSNYSPAAAVGWFFVPLLNLYKPYLVVQEMWGATEEGSDATLGNSNLVLAWWASFVSAPITVLTLATPNVFRGSEPPTSALLIVGALNVVAGALAIIVIAMIDSRWNAKFRLIHGIASVESQPASHTAESAVALEARATSPVAAPMTAPRLPPRPVTAIPVAIEGPPEMSDDEAMDAIANGLRGARAGAIAIAIVAACNAVALLVAATHFVVEAMDSPEDLAHIALILSLGYTGLALLSLVPCARMVRFSMWTVRFANDRNAPDLEAALRMQAGFWAFAGKTSIVFVVFEFVAIAVAIAAPLVTKVL